MVPGSRGCLWLAPFASDGLQFVIEDFVLAIGSVDFADEVSGW